MSYQELSDALFGGMCLSVEPEDMCVLMEKLSVRHREVLSDLYGLDGEKSTRKALGLSKSVSLERVRQVEARALICLRKLALEKYSVVANYVVVVPKEPRDSKTVVLPKLSQSEAEYITGFCEGDGCVYTFTPNHEYENRYPAVCFSQKESDVMEYVESLVPGGTWGRNPSTKVWNLFYHRVEVVGFLTTIMKSCVVGSVLREKLGVSKHVPTIDWLAGFFDAEGCVVHNHPSCGIQLSQKYRDVLDSVREVFGGKVYQTQEEAYEWHLGKWSDGLGHLVEELRRRTHKQSKRDAFGKLLTRLYVEEKLSEGDKDIIALAHREGVEVYLPHARVSA